MQSNYLTKTKNPVNSGLAAFPMRPDLAIPEPPDAPDAVSLPFNREAEEAVLGSVIINQDVYPGVADLLKPSDFYIHRHGWIFAAFGRLAARSDPIDYQTVIDDLGRMGQVEEVGGASSLTVLVNQVPTSLNAMAYAKTVKDCATRRGLIAAANQIAVLAFDPKREISDVMAGALEVVEGQTSQRNRDRFTLRDAAYALEPQPPIEYLVHGLVATSSVSVFYGDPGSKKTYSALSLAVCVANGKPWLDFKTKQSPVLIIDEESGERRLSRRLSEALRGELCEADSPIQYVSLANFKMDDFTDPLIIQRMIEYSGAKLVIFDALADLMDGDENEKADVQPVFSHLRLIAERTDCAIVLIHHAGKAGGYRGSSAIKGAVDLMVQVSSENGSNFINFHSEKNRDGEQSTWAAEAKWTADQFYLTPVERSLKEHFSPAEEYVIKHLTKGPATVSAIQSNVETCSEHAARMAVYSLAKKAKIVRTNPGMKGQAVYALS